MPDERITGYEGKPLKVVIINWLYHPEPDARIGAGVEMRKRLIKAFPRPDWLPEKNTNA